MKAWRNNGKQHAKRMLDYARVADLPSSHVLWAGPSRLTGAPIMAVAMCSRERSENGKTGDMIQVAIMSQTVSPARAYFLGEDGDVCPGDCAHRSKPRGGKGTCYVNKVKLRSAWDRAVALVSAGTIGVPAGFWEGARVRIGNEGDGAAVPLEVWRTIADECAGWTAYTAGWRGLSSEWARIFMASVQTPAEALEASAQGWRFFASSSSPDDDRAYDAISRACLNTSHGVACVACRGCDGIDKGARRASFWIPQHGAVGSALRDKA